MCLSLELTVVYVIYDGVSFDATLPILLDPSIACVGCLRKAINLPVTLWKSLGVHVSLEICGYTIDFFYCANVVKFPHMRS